MEVIVLELGQLGTNCYMLVNEVEKRAVIFDPGAEVQVILAEIQKRELKVEAILLTHGHSDHIGALHALQEATKASVMIGEKDANMLTDAKRNLSVFMGDNISLKEADRLLKDNDIIKAAGYEIKVLSTPGHTPGGVCYKVSDMVFCGDTIFCESIGRTDFPGGSYPEILNSIKTKILTLPDDTKLFPGHGPSTTVGWERRKNPFLQ